MATYALRNEGFVVVIVGVLRSGNAGAVRVASLDRSLTLTARC